MTEKEFSKQLKESPLYILTHRLIDLDNENERLLTIVKKLMQNVWSGFDEWLWLHQEKMCHDLGESCPHCYLTRNENTGDENESVA